MIAGAVDVAGQARAAAIRRTNEREPRLGADITFMEHAVAASARRGFVYVALVQLIGRRRIPQHTLGGMAAIGVGGTCGHDRRRTQHVQPRSVQLEALPSTRGEGRDSPAVTRQLQLRPFGGAAG